MTDNEGGDGDFGAAVRELGGGGEVGFVVERNGFAGSRGCG